MFQKSSTNESNLLTFRHFGRKGYSLFAALGREVKVGVLTVATLSTAAPALAAGQGRISESGTDAAATDSVTSPGRELDEATVIASRAPMTASVAARTVMTFSRDDIAAAGVTSINDVIKLCAGVDVRQRGAFGVQTDISVDGGTFDQITILLNGVNISSPHTGHLSADFPVTALDIERIEVLEGAAARLFGTQAFTGAINIVTRREQNGLALHGYGGMYGYAGGDARLSFTARPGKSGAQGNTGTLGDTGTSGDTPASSWHNHLSGGYSRSDGATDNSQFSASRVFWQGQYDAQHVQLDYQLGYSYKPYGANTFYGAASQDQWECNERWMGALQAKVQAGRLNMAPSVYWNRWNDHYQWHKGSPAGENFHEVDVYGLAVNNWLDWTPIALRSDGLLRQKTSFGIEMRNEGILSTKLGEPLEEPDFYKFAANRTNVSGFFEHNVILPHWTVSAGLLANYNTALAATEHNANLRWHFYPGVDVAYRPDSHWAFFASWNMALRMPTFTDLYYSGTGIVGTRNLRPERTNDLSLKAAYSIPGFKAEACGFYSHKTDMIDWVVLADRPTEDSTDEVLDAADPKNWLYRSGNYTLDNYGVRINAAWLPRHLWGERFPLRKLGMQYCFIDENIDYATDILASKYAMEYVRHKLVASADGRLLRVAAQSSNPRVASNSWRTGELTLGLSYRYCDRVASEDYGLLDARLSWESPHYTLYVEANNVLNTTYYDFSYIRQPGLWVIGGIKLKF